MLNHHKYPRHDSERAFSVGSMLHHYRHHHHHQREKKLVGNWILEENEGQQQQITF